MILASVITCPRRWSEYQRLRRNYERLGLGVPLRTFQTREADGDSYANNNLNARSALAYANRHLPEGGWLLYLEDDVVLHSDLARMLPELVHVGDAERVDVWNLCNRQNPVGRQFRVGDAVVNELGWPVLGAHGLLIPRRHLSAMLAAHWSDVSDQAMFAAICHPGLTIWQVVSPVLVEHVGYVSTYDPDWHPKTLEVNHAN